jgi:hypothetical protein
MSKAGHGARQNAVRNRSSVVPMISIVNFKAAVGIEYGDAALIIIVGIR